MTANRRRGFTLIELLVVIAIIAILAAILFPVYARLKEKATRTQCSVHLRQIALAISQYAEDYDGHFPHLAECAWEAVWNGHPIAAKDPDWEVEIYPYMKNWYLLRCPSANKAERCPNGAWLSYGMNWHLAVSPSAPWANWYSITQIRHPSELIMVADCVLDAAHGRAEDVCFPNLGAETDQDYGKLSVRHGGGSNIAFVDCHMKFMKPQQAEQNYSSKSWNPEFP